MRRLVVIPSDPISAYEKKGRSDLLESYYNPRGMFDEVYIMSPIENTNSYKYGMYISKETTQSFKKKIKAISPDLIRVYGAYWPSDFIAKVRPRNIPVVLSIHDSHPSMIFKSAAFADHLICMSKIVEDATLKKIDIDKQRFIRLPNRVDTTVFHPQIRKKKIQDLLPGLPEGNSILHVGRKSTEKNIDTLISALKHLPEEYFCIFVGQGNKTKYIEQAQKEKVEHRCFWVDSIYNKELVDWYNACSCVCVPSLWEGFGIVFIEAAACGAPIITSNIQPMNEYLKHEESAYLVDKYKSPTAIANSIITICNDMKLKEKISSNAILAASQFDKNKIDEAEVKIYLSLLNKTNLTNNEWVKLLVWRIKDKLIGFFTTTILKPIKYVVNLLLKPIVHIAKRYLPLSFRAKL